MYAKLAAKDGGLQGYVEAMGELNYWLSSPYTGISYLIPLSVSLINILNSAK